MSSKEQLPGPLSKLAQGPRGQGKQPRGNLLAQLIGQQLKKDVLREKERILRESRELCEKNFATTNAKSKIGKELHVHKALDRIKQLKKK